MHMWMDNSLNNLTINLKVSVGKIDQVIKGGYLKATIN